MGVRIALSLQDTGQLRARSVYFKESYKELTQKVSWPSWNQLQSSAIVVMVASVILAAIIFLMDFVFRHLMTTIYNLLY